MRSFAWAVIGAALPAVGCYPEHHVAQTVLHADGSVERAIVQWGYVSQGTGWSDTESVREPSELGARWRKRLAFDRLETPESVDSDHFATRVWGDSGKGTRAPVNAAYGRFASAEALPEHLRADEIPAPCKGPIRILKTGGRLVRAAERRDWVIVAEHRWNETLTDALSGPTEARKLRRVAYDFLLKAWRETLQTAFRDRYDLTALIAWLEVDGRQWFYDMVELALVHMAAREPFEVRRQRLFDAWIELAGEHGLVLTDKAGKRLPAEETVVAIRIFLTREAARLLRTRDGKPVDPAETQGWFVGSLVGSLEPKGELGIAYAKVAKATWGESSITTPLEYLAGALVGHYTQGLRSFDFTLSMPGELVSTNGRILSGNQVRWVFKDSDACLFGYSMEARSITVDAAAQLRIFGRAVLVDRAAVIDFLELVGDRPDIADALSEAECQGDEEPLRRLLNEPDGPPQNARIRKLLGIKPLMPRAPQRHKPMPS